MFVLPALTTGFTSVTLMWAGWFLANLPGLAIPAPAIAAILGGLLATGVILTGRAAGVGGGWKLGLAAGLVAGVVNLIALGSLLTDAGSQSPSIATNLAPSIRPSAPIIAGGFLLSCAAIGAIAGIFANRMPERETLCAQGWLSRFGWIAALATLELILVGGLVTSTNSGLAVPDWPATYGANMFLYPIALMSDPGIFLEHSHRLFGSMVGLTVVVLAVCIAFYARDERSKRLAIPGLLLAIGIGVQFFGLGSAEPGMARTLLAIAATLVAIIWTIAAFSLRSTTGVACAMVALILAQGVLGGLRVTEQSPWFATFHGVLAQVFLALLVAQAVWLSPAWQNLKRSSHRDYHRWKFVATAATHTTILQLAFGAMYRHFGSFHVLMTHLAFSVVVIVFAIMTAAGAMSLERPPAALAKRGPFLAKALIAVVSLQVLLGVTALFSVLGSERDGVPTAEQTAENAPVAEVPMHEMLVATAHQANGAILLALVTMSLVWSKRAFQKNSPESAQSSN